MKKVYGLLFGVCVSLFVNGSSLGLGEALVLGIENSSVLIEARESLRLSLIPIENNSFPRTVSLGVNGGLQVPMTWGDNQDFNTNLVENWPSVSLTGSIIEELTISAQYGYTEAVPGVNALEGHLISLGVQWNPYDPGAIASRKMDQMNKELAYLVYEQALLDFEFTLKEMFVALYNQQQALADQKEMIEIQKRSYQAALNRLEAGLVSAKSVDDLLSSQIASEIQMLEQEQEYLTSVENFSRFLGVEINGRTLSAPELDVNVTELILPNREELSASLSDSLEYQQSLIQLVSSEMGLNVANQWWVPNVSVGADIATNQPGNQWGSILQLQIAFNLSGQIPGQIESAEISAAKARRSMEETEYQLNLEIDQALYDHSVLIRRYELAEYTVQLKEKELERIQFSFEQGDVFEDDVLLAEMELRQAEQALQGKVFEIYMSWLGLRRMAGYSVEELNG